VSNAALTTSAASRAGTSGRRALDAVDLGGSEATLAVGGLLVVALHVLDDNFLQPQPPVHRLETT
jgi:hypothetical protein